MYWAHLLLFVVGRVTNALVPDCSLLAAFP